MIESSLEQIFLTAVPTDYPHQRFITASIEHGTAYPARRCHEQIPSIDMEIDCNIDEFEGKNGRGGVESDKRGIDNVQIGRAERACPDAP
jgi:hypothetical protein